VDTRERYLTRVLERKAAANTACYVDFASGSSEIDLSLGHNATEMGRIRGNILELLQNTSFDLDSIVISASASPEGTVKSNGALAERRAAAVASYFDDYIRHWRDSVKKNSFSVSVDDSGRESIGHNTSIPASIPFLSRSSGENWPYLGVLVDEDTVMTSQDKLSQTLETAHAVRNCITKIEEITGRTIPTDSFSYNRMMNHIRYMVARIQKHEDLKINMNDYVSTTFPESFAIAAEICHDLSKSLGSPTDEMEIGYLAMHIERVKADVLES
jgi:hypothetical protein